MKPVPPSGHSSTPPAVNVTPDGRLDVPTSSLERRRRAVLLACLPLLHFTNPLAWGETGHGLWYPPAGLGLALIAWFGPRAALWVLLDGLLVVTQLVLWRRLGQQQGMGAELCLAAVDAVLGAGILQASWWLYHDRARGARGLGDPRSAMSLLFLVPGVGIGLWAAMHTTLSTLIMPASAGSWRTDLAVFWMGRALGVLILAPPLLVVLTPWLSRRGLVSAEITDSGPQQPSDVVGEGERLRWGDGLEMLGLAAGAAILSGLAVQQGRDHLIGWQLWGAPLLLVVWASLRQGLRGSTLVTAASAGFPMLMLEGDPAGVVFVLLVQANLLGQCAIALLVGSTATWVRGSEARYRQVMAHLPVVIYSARFHRSGRRTRPAGVSAEVTLVSAASEPLLGCAPRALLGDYERWLARVHPDDREVVTAAVAQIARQDQPVTCEYRLAQVVNRGSGIGDRAERSTIHDPLSTSIRWVRDTLAPHLDGDGQLLGWDGVLTDITAQRVLADDLRRTTSMLHALIDNLPAGVFFVQGPLGHPILVNARARQLFGQREDMAAGLDHLAEAYRLHRPDGTLYPVEELPVFLALRKGVTAMRDDIVVHRPDGGRTPLVSWAAPVMLGRGAPSSTSNQPDAAVWVLEDLTSLHQAESARRDTEGRLRAVLETMAEGLLVQDHTGRIIDCNTTAGDILGHPVERLRGMALDERDWAMLREDKTCLTPDDYPVAQVLRLDRPVRNLVLGIFHPKSKSEGSSPKSEEEVRWVLVNAMPLGGAGARENHAVTGVVTTFVDVTASRHAQKRLRESEEKHRDLVESLPLMVIQADANMRVTYANPATRNITGYELSEIADPQLWGALIHVDDLGVAQKLGQNALEGRSGRAEFRYRAKDGSQKVGLALSEPRRRADGAILGTTTLIVDVTRERQLEQELLRAQRMDLVGRLASGIAHDFNNLLSVVLSLTELVGSSLSPDHEGHADLTRITEATEQAAHLANQLLDYSKQRHIAAHRIEVNGTAGRTLTLLRASLPSRINLKTELAVRELFIQADETQVQQVLMNLCLNGRDAMPEGGALYVQTAFVADESEWVRLSVRDQGTGMTDHVKAHLFDPFFSTKEHGTGLGLAVVQQIVESHGGHVDVFSELGQGTRFDVWWPYSPPERDNRTERAAPGTN